MQMIILEGNESVVGCYLSLITIWSPNMILGDPAPDTTLGDHTPELTRLAYWEKNHTVHPPALRDPNLWVL